MKKTARKTAKSIKPIAKANSTPIDYQGILKVALALVLVAFALILLIPKNEATSAAPINVQEESTKLNSVNLDDVDTGIKQIEKESSTF